VSAALAISNLLEESYRLIKQALRAHRPPLPRTVQIRGGAQLLTAEDPIPMDLRDALRTATRCCCHCAGVIGRRGGAYECASSWHPDVALEPCQQRLARTYRITDGRTA
jgi:hypothetical protein